MSPLHRFKTAINLLNHADLKKLERIASTVITRLGNNKDESVFTDAENEQLRAMLDVNAEDLDIIVSGCSYIWDQAAFYNLTADKLASQLQEHSMSDAAVNVFGSVWAASKLAFINKLRSYTFGAPKVLSDVDWQLKLTTSHQDLSKTKVCNSVLNLQLSDANDSSKVDNILLEFSKEQLYELFNQLETVQSQLDHISK